MEWTRELQYLAEQWQPRYVPEIMHYYTKRKEVLSSDKAAFADTYERYFLNPNTEVMHQ